MPYYPYQYVAAAQYQQPNFALPPYQQPWVAPPQNSPRIPQQNTRPSYPQNAQRNAPQNQYQQQNRVPRYQQNEARRIDPLPMTYSQLWPYLVSSKAIEPRPTQPKTSNFPAGYNPNVKCDFHSGVAGHSIEDCKVLKEKVQDLIDKKVLTFADVPQVIANPLP